QRGQRAPPAQPAPPETILLVPILFAMTHSVSRYFERAVGTLPHLSRTFRLIWRAAPNWTLAWVFLLLIQGFLPVATVYLTRPVVNGIVAAVRSGGDWRPIVVPAVLMAAVLLLGITLAAMLVVLAGFGVCLPLALLASTLPTLAVVLRHAVQQHEFRIRTTPVERRTWYYDWLLTTGETAPEIRLFDLGGHLREAYQNLRNRLRMERVDLARRQGMAQ